jgi:uncharacterized oxidoreductase
MVKQFLPHLKTRTFAAIVNISSGLAFVPLPIAPIYCGANCALLHAVSAWPAQTHEDQGL